VIAAAPNELRNAGQIYIPPSARLGDVVVNVSDLKKCFGLDSMAVIDNQRSQT